MKPIRVTAEDLKDSDKVIALGRATGAAWMDGMKEAVMNMSMENRVFFFAALLGVEIGCIYRSIGPAAARAMLDESRRIVDDEAAGHGGTRH